MSVHVCALSCNMLEPTHDNEILAIHASDHTPNWAAHCGFTLFAITCKFHEYDALPDSSGKLSNRNKVAKPRHSNHEQGLHS